MMPAKIVGLCLPPSSPARNPRERLWQEVNAHLAWVVPPHIEKWEHRVEMSIRQSTTATLHSLTSYPYVVQAIHALCS